MMGLLIFVFGCFVGATAVIVTALIYSGHNRES